MRRIGIIILGLAAAGLLALFVVRPERIAPEALAGLTGDATRGEVLYNAAGCAGCHTAPDSEDRQRLAGGQRITSPFGTFLVPNISTDPDHGIGTWTDEELVTAMLKGTSPDGAHYYPAFPYASYARGTVQEALDIATYLRTLPADPTPSLPHELGFPFNLRVTLGGWKLLFLKPDWVVPDEALTTDGQRLGRALVESWGHCGECHTPRNALGGPQLGNWLAGGPNPSGEGRIPDIRPAALQWSANDIAAYLDSGFTPDFDTAGGEMVEVIENMALLPDGHRAAIADYLTALPD